MENQPINQWSLFSPNSTEAWIKQINKELKGKTWEEALTFEVEQGIKLKPFYTHTDRLELEKPRGYAGWMLRKDFQFEDINSAVSKIDHYKSKGVNYIGIVFNEIADDQTLKVILAAASVPMVFIFKEKLTLDYFKRLSLLKNEFGISVRCENSIEELVFFSDQILGNKQLWYTYYLKSYANNSIDQLTEICRQGYDIFKDCKNVDSAASQVVLELSIGDDFFLEIAKLRALRLLWANLVKSFQGNLDSRHTFIHACCEGTSALDSEPYRLLISNTSQSLASVLGGADTLQLRIPDIEEQEDMLESVAAGISHLLKHESHLDITADPAHGSYYIDYLTHTLVRQSWEKFKHQLSEIV